MEQESDKLIIEALRGEFTGSSAALVLKNSRATNEGWGRAYGECVLIRHDDNCQRAPWCRTQEKRQGVLTTRGSADLPAP